MRKKRILVRTLTRALYAGGIVFLVSGMLLSAISTPVLAAETSSPAGLSNTIANLFDQQQETLEPFCATCGTPQPVTTITTQPGGDTGSSLIFAASCECGCEYVRATVCNVGDAGMTGPVEWRLYYSANGNPQLGSVVLNGNVEPLASGQCTTFDVGPGAGGNFMYRVFQEEGYEGPNSIWSSSCMVSGDCFPGPSATPTQPSGGVTPTYTATVPFVEITLTPTPSATTPAEVTRTPTREPMPFNLSFICGYASDDELLWRVYNQTDETVEYTWQVEGSDESGSGEVEANGTEYFSTSLGDKTVHVFVDGERVDSATSGAFCKQELSISYACAADGSGIDWFVQNPNDFPVRYSWVLNGENSGSNNDLAASSSERVTTSPLGENNLVVTWTDTRPGEHTVSATANIESCGVINTATPTATATVPFVEVTFTPTATATYTSTPTATATVPFQIVTFTPTATATYTSTPTATATVPFQIVTFTPTATVTNTSTPTATATVPFQIVTITPTSTATPTATNTSTATVTQPGPTATFTSTPTVTSTPTITATVPFQIVTLTSTVTSTPTPTATLQPTITSTPTGTATVPFVVVTQTATPTATATVPFVVVTQTSTVTATPSGTATVPFVVVTPSATPSGTATVPFQVVNTATPTATATQIVTLAPPAATSTPPIIPVTGDDMLAPVMATNLLGKMFTNVGLFMLGLALALTGITSQWKK